jgi:hypothetical protein
VAQFERSGERQADSCAQRGLGLSSLHHWLYQPGSIIDALFASEERPHLPTVKYAGATGPGAASVLF